MMRQLIPRCRKVDVSYCTLKDKLKKWIVFLENYVFQVGFSSKKSLIGAVQCLKLKEKNNRNNKNEDSMLLIVSSALGRLSLPK